jgi:hypothetical protein
MRMTRFVAISLFAVSTLLASSLAAAEPEEGKFYRIINVNSNKCLALADGAKKVDEAQIVQRNHGQNERQQWSFVKVGEGRNFRIINREGGQALSVHSTDAGAPVVASNSAKNRQWSFEKKGDNYVIKSRHSDLVLDVADESTERKAPLIQAKANDGQNQLFKIEEVTN